MRTRFAACLLSLACAHGPPRATAPVRQLTDQGREQLSHAPTDYQGGASTPVELGQKLESGLRLPCTHDDRLDVLAGIIADTMVTTGQLPARSLTQWLMWRVGVTGELHALQAWSAGGEAEELLDKALRDYAATVPPDARGAPLHYGVARALQPFGSEWGQVVVLTAVPLELDALPKQVKGGGKVELRGRFNVKAVSPTLYVDDSDTKVREVPVQPGADGRFHVSFDAPATPGRRFIEVSALDAEESAENPQWMRSLLMVPLYVDAPEPTEPDGFIRAPAPNPAQIADWPRRALQLYNERRTAAGLKPLEMDGVATSIAGTSAKSLAQSEDAPPEPNLLPRLARAGLPTRNAQQHGGRVEFLDEATALTLYSPSLRLTLLNPSVTRVGIAYEPVVADRRARPNELFGDRYAGSAVFVAPIGTLDPTAESAALTEGLNRLRKKAGKSELQLDPKFSALAMTHAQATCEGKAFDADGMSSEANALGFSGGMMLTYTVTQLLAADLVHEPRLVEAAGTHVAVGVCQGAFEGQPKAERVLFLVSSKVATKRGK